MTTAWGPGAGLSITVAAITIDSGCAEEEHHVASLAKESAMATSMLGHQDEVWLDTHTGCWAEAGLIPPIQADEMESGEPEGVYLTFTIAN
jgi:hypothetical protein